MSEMESEQVKTGLVLYGVCDLGSKPKMECEDIVLETANSYFVAGGLNAYRYNRRIEKGSACLDEASAWRAFRGKCQDRLHRAQFNVERAERDIALANAALEAPEAPVADSTSKTVRVRVADLIPVLRMAVRARSAEALLSRRMSYIDDGYGSRTVRAEREAIDAHFASFPKAVPLAWADACWELARELPAKSGGDKAVEALELIHERGCSWYADDSFTPEGTCLETDPEEVESQMCPACVAEAALNASTPLPLPSAPTVEAEVKP